MNSGPISLAAEVKVESSVDRLWVMKMMLVMEKTAVPKYLDTAEGCPALKCAKILSGTRHGCRTATMLPKMPVQRAGANPSVTHRDWRVGRSRKCAILSI